MPPIKNWSRVVTNNVSDIKKTYARTGTVRMWQHTDGDTLSVEFWRDESEYSSDYYYAILYNGEAVDATETLNHAVDDLVQFMKAYPGGIPE